MKRRLFLVALLILFGVSGVHAADNKFSITATDGNRVKITNLGKMVGLKVDTEVMTTSDTLTAAESGKVFLVSPATNTVTLTLPTAAAGLEYTFVVADGHADTAKTLQLAPQSTDLFVGCVSSTVTTTFALGDKLSAPNTPATGDSLTIVGTPTKWTCLPGRTGTWVDAN